MKGYGVEYTVRASQVTPGVAWEVTYEGEPIGHVRRLDRIPSEITPKVAERLGIPANDVRLRVETPFAQEVVKVREHMAELEREASRLEAKAAREWADLALRLRGTHNLTGREVATVMGVSEQRVSQLLRGKKS